MDKKEYPSYSKVHNSYTRIDHFLVEASALSNISNPEFHTRVISDHRPVSLQIQIDLPKFKQKCRFNPQLLLLSPGFKAYMNNIPDFLEENDNGEVSDSTLWEALKAIIWKFEYKRRQNIRKGNQTNGRNSYKFPSAVWLK